MPMTKGSRPLTLAISAAILGAGAVPLPANSTPANSRLIAVGAHLAQVRSFAQTEGEKVWRDYGNAPFGFVIVTEAEENLLCRDQVPSGFSPAGLDAATECKRYTRPLSGLPKNLLAAMPLFGPPAVIIMGTPEATGMTEESWVRTILHEHFHQWQYALPDYFPRIDALDLHNGDRTGMWILNYPFPYEDPRVEKTFADASQKLSEAVAARETPEFLPAFDRYIAARQALATAAGERNWRYLELQLWQEGVARWTEIALGKLYPLQEVRGSARQLELDTLDELKNPNLRERKREAVYAYGAGEAMLLEECWPEWRSEYATQLALQPLLQLARARCRGAVRTSGGG